MKDERFVSDQTTTEASSRPPLFSGRIGEYERISAGTARPPLFSGRIGEYERISAGTARPPLFSGTIGEYERISAVTARPPLFSGRSYVVALSLWEQLLASAFNYRQLQCWTMSLTNTSSPISTVEPQLIENSSILGFSFAEHTIPVVSDVFDMESWDSQWPKHGPPLAPLTPRTNFIEEIKNFHKDVIIVQLNLEISKEWECPFTLNISSLMNDLHQYPFLNVKRKVCIYYASKKFPVEEFNQLVFGDIGFDNTLVVIDEWRGIRGGRIDIIGSPCIIARPPYSHLKPSAGVLKDAEAYASKYLGGFGQYVSVSARFEKVAINYWQLSMDKRREAVTVGIKETLDKVESLKKRVGIDDVYLAYDFGWLGSVSFKKQRFYNSSDLLMKFQEDLYNGRLSYSEYEESFMMFKSQNPGYVAMVQMTLSSRGKCLLQVGWGHCIEFVKSLFRIYHSGHKLCLECAPHSVCNKQNFI